MSAPALQAAVVASALLAAGCEGDGAAAGGGDGQGGAATATPAVSESVAIPTPTATAPPERKPIAPVGDPPEDRWGDSDRWPGTFEEQNAQLFAQLVYEHGISAAQRERLEALFTASERLGQGNPAISRHPASVAECKQKLADEKVSYTDLDHEAICGARWMAPLYDPTKESAEDAKACIDKFEFPNIPCAYPVTWARANEVVEICEAMGKRICDAHEWEGACYGRLEPLDEAYDFGLKSRMKLEHARKAQRHIRNNAIDKDRHWAYGDKPRKDICATAGRKSKDCGVGWKKCGTNTFPAGFFPGCISKLGVLDQHGNAAEHMNLPLSRDQLASSPEKHYGITEMKGSWFVFNNVDAHEDHCRWRAPFWHGTDVTNPNSHRNYHLGFRCCKDVVIR